MTALDIDTSSVMAVELWADGGGQITTARRPILGRDKLPRVVATTGPKYLRGLTVTAVYEALAHLRSATHAYVIYHVPEEIDESAKQVIDEARRIGRAHGVGIITMNGPAKWDTREVLEEARRHEPDPERLDEFIAVQLTRDAQDDVARALH